MGSGWSTCPHTPPSFSPPSTSGPFWMSRSPTSTSRPWPISSTSSPSAVAFSMAISSNPAQTSTGGPSQLPRSDQPETVSQVIGYIKGKSAIHLARVYGERKRNFVGQHFWARGYFVSTVGRDEAVIRSYIQKQEQEDRHLDQLNLWR